MNVIEVSNLNYNFSKSDKILRDLNIKIPKGSIYGLLGANGAGKTTTLRLVLGLLKLQKGVVSIFGKDLHTKRVEILSKTGTLIETPSLYTHLSAYDNLKVWQTLYNCEEERIAGLLKIVGLDKIGRKKAGKFSLGMKQRLAIAIALLNDPELLVLDEPTNGLDPNGIVEIRELLVSLNKNLRITIVISSHILAEIEKIATHIGLINNGAIVFEGTLQQLINRQQQCEMIEISAQEVIPVIEALRNKNRKFELKNEHRVHVSVSNQEDISDLIEFLIAHKLKIYEVKQIRNDLETIFMNIIK